MRIAYVHDLPPNETAVNHVQRFAADRYWAKLQADHPFYIFRCKIGYQRPTWSSIQRARTYNFD